MTTSIRGYSPIKIPVGNDIGREALRNQMQQLSPITNKAINSLSQLAQFSDNQSPYGMDAYKQQQENIFNQQTIPSILQRFGGQKGSGLNNSLAAASQGLGQNLAARREDMQMSAIAQLLGLNNQLMNTQDYQHGFLQKPQSNLNQFLSSGLPAISSLISDIMPSGWAAKIARGFTSPQEDRSAMRRQNTDFSRISPSFGLPDTLNQSSGYML